MSLRLKPPRAGKSSNYSIRGTYLGVRINRTAGTPEKAVARRLLEKLKHDIEGGRLAGGEKVKTFASAALSYLRAGGERRFIRPLIDHFELTALDDIDQERVDEAAALLYPTASPATRNRQVYTPISAIRRHAGIATPLRRPKGAQGEVRVDWLWPEQAFKLLTVAREDDPEFALFLVVLLYCGNRLGEVLAMRVGDVNIGESFAFIGKTKNGEPRPVHLPPVVVAELANHPRGLNREADERLFRFRKNGALYLQMDRVRAKAALPVHATFHTMRHTWATWMRRYAAMDLKALADTGAWKDPKSVARYAHVVTSEEARKSDLLPTWNRGKAVE